MRDILESKGYLIFETIAEVIDYLNEEGYTVIKTCGRLLDEFSTLELLVEMLNRMKTEGRALWS